MKLHFLDTFKSKKDPLTLFIAFMALLFEFACAYNVFNIVAETHFLSGKKHEARDIEEAYAEKQSNPDVALVSPTLFTSLPGIILEFLPSFSSPDILFTETFSVLRC